MRHVTMVGWSIKTRRVSIDQYITGVHSCTIVERRRKTFSLTLGRGGGASSLYAVGCEFDPRPCHVKPDIFTLCDLQHFVKV